MFLCGLIRRQIFAVQILVPPLAFVDRIKQAQVHVILVEQRQLAMLQLRASGGNGCVHQGGIFRFLDQSAFRIAENPRDFCTATS